MNYWTRVPISDELAARVISSYLSREHPILGLFDADLFVTDLVERRLRFCTPFLLCTLMCYACVSSMVMLCYFTLIRGTVFICCL